MKEIRLGTIGSGFIVHNILDNVQRTEGICLEAVYSRSEETGQALGAKYGARKVYTDLDAFLQDDTVNFVYIATPNSLHYAQTKKALLAGKNVILEKPFCTKAADATELIQLAEARGLFLIDAVPTAYLPNLEILKRELPKIGNIKLVMTNFSQYSSRYDKLLQGDFPNIFNPEFGGGCLMDINFYNIYLNVALFGKPRKTVYYPNRFQDSIDTSGIVILQYDGFVSQNAGAKDTWGVNFVQIEGDRGYIYVSGGNGLESIRVVTKNGEAVFNAQDDPDRWSYEVSRITELVLSNDRHTLRTLLDVTQDVMETLEDARSSAGICFPGD